MAYLRFNGLFLVKRFISISVSEAGALLLKRGRTEALNLTLLMIVIVFICSTGGSDGVHC